MVWEWDDIIPLVSGFLLIKLAEPIISKYSVSCKKKRGLPLKEGGSSMTIDLTYYDHAKTLVSRISGRITFQDMLSHHEAVQVELRARDVRIRLMDLEGLTEADINTDQLEELAHNNLQVIQANPVKDMLVLAPGDLQYGLCRMWEAFASLEKNALHIFRSTEALDAYLKEKYDLDPFL